jgi:hypothetical protein
MMQYYSSLLRGRNVPYNFLDKVMNPIQIPWNHTTDRFNRCFRKFPRINLSDTATKKHEGKLIQIPHIFGVKNETRNRQIMDIYINLTPQEKNDTIRIFSDNEEKAKLLYQSEEEFVHNPRSLRQCRNNIKAENNRKEREIFIRERKEREIFIRERNEVLSKSLANWETFSV